MTGGLAFGLFVKQKKWNNKMRNFGLCIFAWLPLAVLLSGCSGSSVQLELPSSHPAHPQAAQSLYQPPPNYFEGRLLGGQGHSSDKLKMQPPPSDHMTGGHSGHGSDDMSTGDNSVAAPEDQTGDKHMEHGQ